MKKIFTLLLAISLSVSAYSTHLMGGQITTTYLSSDSNGIHYTLNLDVYRDTIGVPMNLNQTVDVYELDLSTGSYNLLFSDSIDFGVSGSMPTMSLVYGVEIYHFSDSIVFPTDGYYMIKWDDCCRNGAIINMVSPLTEDMTFLTYVNVNSSDPNSSPTYLAPPVIYLPANTVWQYNPLPFDPDGDSLVWNLSVPLSGTGLVTGYESLDDTVLYSNTTGVFSMDSVTGQITWDPKMVGNFVVSFAIEEYRNGVLVGAMSRDMQFVVIPDTTNAFPMISNINNVPTNSIGYPYVKINPGQNYQLHLLASDPDVNDVVSLQAFGESFSQTTTLSDFLVTPTGNGNEINGKFSWCPDVADVRESPYIVVFRTSDGQFYFDETIQFEVTLSTELASVNGFHISEIYPNPANNRLYTPISLDKSEEISIEVYNVLGVKQQDDILDLPVGNHLIVKELDLNSGQYLIVFKNSKGLTLSTQQLVVVK